MSLRIRYLHLLPLVIAVVSCSTADAEFVSVQRSATGASSGPWLQYRDVRQAGFDDQALRAVCEQADRLRTGAVMVVFRGHVILACGDVKRPFEAHSIRKSLVSGLYGAALARREIDLDATLTRFTIDELTPLTPAERSATIRQVIAARSGIYLPAAYAPASQERRPARGSHSPGTHWFYNNWDFNIAGVIYEQATREDLYESFDRRIAKPLGMEDWRPSDGFRVYEPTKSRHPAHTFRISTRDLARFGQLYLQDGRWEERQLLPIDWVRESTRPHTDDGDGTGYGYMWWTYQRGSTFTAKYPMLGQHTFFRGLGTGEQGLWVIRDADLVVVHRADTDNGRTISSEDHWKLVESILAARRREPQPNPELRELTPAALSSQLPPAPLPEYRALSRSALDAYLGEYKLSPGAARLAGRDVTPGGTVRVFLFDDMPYLHLPGAGDVMMFPTGRDTFTIRAAPGLAIAFARGTNDKVTTVILTVNGSTLTGVSVPPQ
jgi:CubicO group peptidase (beta-lactamase class C family)